jgi:hypothetical protein
VNIFVWFHATLTACHPDTAACLTSKWNKTFLVQVKYCSIKAIKLTYVYYERCCRCCPCTGTQYVPFKKVEIHFMDEMSINDFEMPVSCAVISVVCVLM